MAALVLLWSGIGCSGLDATLERGRQGLPERRRNAVLELAATLRAASPGDPRTERHREQIGAFLLERFPGGEGVDPLRPNVEQDTVVLTQMVSLAVQGNLACAAEIAARAARSTEATVRLIAAQALRDVAPTNRKELLFDLLLRDTDLLVRIEAAKSIARVGDSTWVRPLALVIVNPAEDGNLRYQCHRAGNTLLNAELPYLPARWTEWLAGEAEQ